MKTQSQQPDWWWEHWWKMPDTWDYMPEKNHSTRAAWKRVTATFTNPQTGQKFDWVRAPGRVGGHLKGIERPSLDYEILRRLDRAGALPPFNKLTLDEQYLVADIFGNTNDHYSTYFDPICEFRKMACGRTDLLSEGEKRSGAYSDAVHWKLSSPLDILTEDFQHFIRAQRKKYHIHPPAGVRPPSWAVPELMDKRDLLKGVLSDEERSFVSKSKRKLSKEKLRFWTELRAHLSGLPENETKRRFPSLSAGPLDRLVGVRKKSA